jgi:hypothetical protein
MTNAWQVRRPALLDTSLRGVPFERSLRCPLFFGPAILLIVNLVYDLAVLFKEESLWPQKPLQCDVIRSAPIVSYKRMEDHFGQESTREKAALV